MTSPQTQYLFRIEGVNLYSVLNDTRQLSVRRGGSLLLKQAIDDINSEFDELESISTGASVGLFKSKQVISNEDAQNIQTSILKLLRGEDNNKENSQYYQHLTFVVDHVPYTENDENAFQTAKEQVIALNRFRQFQQSTLAIPEKNTDANKQPCTWDNIRPAVDQNKQEIKRENIKNANASLSTNLRHQYGRKQKHKYINNLIATIENSEDQAERKYVKDLHELARSKDAGKLNDKMAIFYCDGNSFSKILKDYQTAEEYKAFDDYIQDKRKVFLQKLIEKADKEGDFKNKNAIRLELILWGGDEMILIVPAWKGMEVLQLFYQVSNNWGYGGNKLKHAGSLIFCHVKTPIEQMQKLAREMADYVKDRGEKRKNQYDYLVLESIDYPTEAYDDFLKKRYQGQKNNWEALSLPTGIQSWDKAKEKFTQLIEEVPRRQAYQLALSKNYKTQLSEYKELIGEESLSKQLNTLKAIFGELKHEQNYWRHLIELWDYIT